ncbi:MAG: N-6 DNA methylase [Bacteroidetes bacterium]|nr:N-6 DNA methylase [Bacteroidota bacterium]
MDKTQAQQLVKETFENPFDKERFINFTINLLKLKREQIEHKHPYSGNIIPDSYEQYISTLERIGKYSDGDNKIDILIVKLKKETSIERARTMQRNFIARYLNGSRGGELKDAALVAYVSPNGEDWRFSLVKMDYRFEQSKNGKVKVKEEFTPAKRWSFLVGIYEASHTAQSKLAPIIESDKHNPTLAELEEAFNIEKATKEFFEKYQNLFIWSKETLEEVVANDKKIKADFKAKGVNPVDFSKKLLGQIVFLYFLQKKGWFGVARDADWGTGPKNFLRELFDGKHGKYKNFFNDILEPLFYEALRNDRSYDDHYFSMFKCKIPFLNGGLFDPINDYDWKVTDILLPNRLFSNTTKTKEGDTGNGILDIFDRYNFTVKEDEPLEKEVAVDPEMLGKVFENLLEVKDRKSKGTYYTPREIVHYMCQQSLINYLCSEFEENTVSYEKIGETQLDMLGNIPKKGQLDLESEHKEGTKISKEDIETLIKFGEQVGENEAIVTAKGKETDTYYYKLPESIRLNAKLLDEKLENIKVCDPAVGSGAFLVGMMSEIVRARMVLRKAGYVKHKIFDEKSNEVNNFQYWYKKQAIQNSLYGVDIDAGAVEIAKLRLWLSLIVDEEDIKNIRPLPNLDYKIVCGNSLLGVEKTLFNDELFHELERLKPLLFNETSPSKKQEYKKQIDELISQITNGHKEFDFEVYFSEVFHTKGGFDVVIANPPYVNIEEIDLKLKPVYSKFHTAYQKYDLYILFFEKGLELVRNKGNLIFITSNKYLSQGYGFKLRQLFLKNQITKIINFNYDVFESSVVRTAIIQVVKQNVKSDNYIAIMDINTQKEADKFFKHQYSYIKQEVFNQIEENNFRINLTNEKIKILKKIEQNCLQVYDICSVNYGLRPVSTIEGQDKYTFIKKENSKKKYKIYFEGKDMGYWLVKNYSYLDYRPNVMYNPMFPELFENEKLVGLCTLSNIEKLRFVYDDTGMYCNHSVGILTLWHKLEGIEYTTIKRTITKEKIETSKQFSYQYLQAILNSRMIKFYVNELLYDGTHFYPNHMKILPIKKIQKSEQKPFIDIVDKILEAKKKGPTANTTALEREIDEMVYKLYGLTPEEIEIVESSSKK